MTPTETTTILRQFNEWRRGDEDIPQFDPREIGKAIDAAVEMIERLEAAEKERDELRAEVAEMERQEPVAKVESWTNGSYTRHYKLKWLRDVDEEAALYALPGAQPKLNEIKIALQRALELGQRQTWTGARKHRSWEDQREEQQCWNKVWSLLGTQGEEK